MVLRKATVGERFDRLSDHLSKHETFFEESEKGKKDLERPGRKRGSSTSGKAKNRGILDNKAAVIATADRAGGMSLCVATMGRIGKEDISCSISGKLSENTILCTDGHVSYKGFAMDNKINHVVLRAGLNQHVKNGVYHIQHVNSIHNRLKKWTVAEPCRSIDNTFWGVSTKYLQNFLGWFRLNEKLKGSASFGKDFLLRQYRILIL
jgi:hypothetical protein